MDALWRDGGADGQLLRDHARQFNNALALASEMYEEVEMTGWKPSIVIQGKLYNMIGALTPHDGQRAVFCPAIRARPWRGGR